MSSERLNLTVDEGIGSMMAELADGERKRGAWLSDVVRSMYGARTYAQTTDLEQMRMIISSVIGKQKEIEGRLQQVETQLAAITAKG